MNTTATLNNQLAEQVLVVGVGGSGAAGSRVGINSKTGLDFTGSD